MCPVWLLVAVVVVGGARGAVSQCWDHPSCREADSSVMDCIQLCLSDLNAERPVIPGPAHLQPPPDSAPPSSFILPSSSFSPQAKRSYSMEHFRWGKPIGRKRRPVKVYAPNGAEDVEMRRRRLADARWEEEEQQEEREKSQEVMEEEEEEQEEEQLLQEKKDGSYRMKHFHWSGPAAAKRYGGFMKSWDERSQRPLLTLFKNVINKDGQQQE